MSTSSKRFKPVRVLNSVVERSFISTIESLKRGEFHFKAVVVDANDGIDPSV
jgi:hypothetical protein